MMTSALLLPLRRSALVLLAAAPGLAACGSRDAGGTGTWEGRVDTFGDTTVVHTISGSVWRSVALVPDLRIGTLDGREEEMFGSIQGLAVGSSGDIYVYDRTGPTLRRFGPDGRYLGQLGRRGSGPGEYENSDGGLAVLTNGRVVLRDPGNGRFTVFDAAGRYLLTVPTRARSFTSTPLVATSDGGFLSPLLGAGRPGTFLVRHDESAAPVDTLQVPLPDFSAPTVSASTEGASQTWRVPFAPGRYWAVSAEREFLTGVSDRYAIDRHTRDGGVLRVFRSATPVAVSSAERAAAEATVIAAMRRLDPAWRWNGPPIPAGKPHYRQFFVGLDDRLWVLLHREGIEVADQAGGSGADGPRFVEPVVFDVFGADGRYLGQVGFPEGYSTYPPFVFGREHVWAVVRDELDVESVGRFRLVVD